MVRFTRGESAGLAVTAAAITLKSKQFQPMCLCRRKQWLTVCSFLLLNTFACPTEHQQYSMENLCFRIIGRLPKAGRTSILEFGLNQQGRIPGVLWRVSGTSVQEARQLVG